MILELHSACEEGDNLAIRIVQFPKYPPVLSHFNHRCSPPYAIYKQVTQIGKSGQNVPRHLRPHNQLPPITNRVE
uniref:Uncharacterized protein n=1 Tax=Cucumis melo TaxID=3656 RepID=A0A9I9EBT7_CUCME